MRSYTVSAIILALLALLLVMAAAFIFLFQADIRLRDQARNSLAEADALRQTQAETELRLGAAEATRDATSATLATAEAAGVVLESQLVESRQEAEALGIQVSDLSGELDEVKAALVELQNEQESAPPQAWIIDPAADATLPAGQPVNILIAASDPAGLISVTLRIDDEEFSTYSVDEQTYFWRAVTWTPPADAENPAAEGEHTISIVAENANGVSSAAATLSFTLVDIESRNSDIRAEVEQNVIGLRGLQPLATVEPLTLSREQMRARIEADFAADNSPEESREDVLAFAAFDFLERDFDLYAATVDLHSEGILGFYDPETAEFVVVSDDVLLDPAAQWTHAHEFVHVLQDQHYTLEDINDDALDSEARAALRALAEGEAELVQYLYLFDGNYFSRAEAESIINGVEQTDGSYLDGLPPILISNLAFPYREGADFAAALYRQGGAGGQGSFEALDAAWANPPTTTEHILHPERYLAGDQPQIVSLPPLTDTLGAGYELIDSDILGEFFLREYLAQQLTDDQTEEASTGWGGDRYAVYYDATADALVMALRLAWDTPEDAAEFAALYPVYAEALTGGPGAAQPDGSTCWSGADVICFVAVDGESFVARGPDLQTAAAVLATIAGE